MKKILVVIDMQNDFITGSLGTKEAQAIVPNVIKKINEYDKIDDSVIYVTQDTHYSNYLETQEGRNLPIKHCIKDSHGWKIQESVQKALDDYKEKHNIVCYHKETFGSNKLADNMYIDFFDDNELYEIEFVGLCTDICVISNVLSIKANLPEVKMIVDASCCAGVTPQSHKNALEAMKMCQVEIINE
ncbi:cysteine hydrolase [Clostridium butyricum]|uniref:cysteine hydrolase family protein n=1 Tax=Clostridium butyricum TaxID=1492 RepID=UPI00232C73EC|nr:isochorismatase family cysteine hydrolase [Clostridium butyricum]MDB2160163.1 cysteine hydrolase [Clostridium butyricum]